MELIIEANFNSTFKKELVLFCEDLKNVFNTESVKLTINLADNKGITTLNPIPNIQQIICIYH